MSTGENEIVIAFRPGWGNDVLREFLVVMDQEWPDAIVEEVHEPIAVPLNHLGEDFREGTIFKDHNCLIDRTVAGETEENQGTRVCVLLKRKTMVITLDNLDSDMGKKLQTFAQIWRDPVHL